MILIDLFRIVALLAFVAGVNGFFSISYQPAQNENAKMMNFGSTFVAPPTADQVADVYSRLSCRPPLLWEGIFWIYSNFYIVNECFSQIKSIFLPSKWMVSMQRETDTYQFC